MLLILFLNEIEQLLLLGLINDHFLYAGAARMECSAH